MKLRIAALIFGIAFLGAGLAWHLPLLFKNNLLFGLFLIDSTHNKVHLLSGLLALAATMSSRLARLYFKIAGGIYLLLAILGFILQDQFLAMQINFADSVLHAIIGFIALSLGFKKARTGK